MENIFISLKGHRERTQSGCAEATDGVRMITSACLATQGIFLSPGGRVPADNYPRGVGGTVPPSWGGYSPTQPPTSPSWGGHQPKKKPAPLPIEEVVRKPWIVVLDSMNIQIRKFRTNVTFKMEKWRPSSFERLECTRVLPKIR